MEKIGRVDWKKSYWAEAEKCAALTAELAAVKAERDALLALACGKCDTCCRFSPDGKCGQDCDGYDHWTPGVDLSDGATRLLKALRIADSSKLALALYDYPAIAKERDALRRDNEALRERKVSLLEELQSLMGASGIDTTHIDAEIAALAAVEGE